VTTVTLEQVRAEHARLGAMIASLTVQTPVVVFTVPEVRIELQPGERYAGLVLNADGSTSHHLVLLAGDAEDVTWQAAKDWAAEVGGELPTRQEQALLYANVKGAFVAAWYWSSEAHESDGACAWTQTFGNGFQYDLRKSYEGRARAVRRFPA
jgi:hypothetical protein